MDITNRRILVLGGWGLVGMAVVQRLLEKNPQKLIISSLREEEAKEAKNMLSGMFPEVDIETVWGNIFVRESLKDLSRNVLLENDNNRSQLISDIMEKLNDEIISSSFLFSTFKAIFFIYYHIHPDKIFYTRFSPLNNSLTDLQ